MSHPTPRLIDRCGVDMIDSIHGYYWDDLFGEYMVKVDLIDSKGRIHRGCIAADDLLITEARHAATIAGAQDQFADSSKMVSVGSGAERAVADDEEPEPTVTRSQLLHQLADALDEADFDALDEGDLILLVGILGRHTPTAQQSCKEANDD
ncbi:hypothetical protein [Gordonia aichiensis]|uniref:hypothetical protein n=1 Tax=Gordonia aichiensis TaxID=36820 RepID=UPI00326342EF